MPDQSYHSVWENESFSREPFKFFFFFSFFRALLFEERRFAGKERQVNMVSFDCCASKLDRDVLVAQVKKKHPSLV